MKPRQRATFRLEEVCEEITVGHVGPMADKYVSDGIPFLRSQNIEAFRLRLNDVKFIDTAFDAKLKKSRLKPGDVAIVRTGYPGTACVIPPDLSVANCADLVIVRPSNKIDPWYLAGVMNSTWGQTTVAGNLVGVAQQHFNVGAAKALQIQLPSLADQQAIGDLLRTFANLIENNTLRIAVLEEMARRIFEEWFVCFRAAGCDNAKLRDSIIGPLPTDWCVEPLGKYIAIESGSRPKGGIAAVSDGVPSIGAENINGLGKYDYSKERLIPRDFFDAMRRGKVKNGDVMLYKDGAHVGRKALFRDGYPYHECAINEHVFALRPTTPVTPAFLYFWLDLPENTNRIRQLNSNAAQPGINQRGVNGLPCLFPPPSLIGRFTELVEPILALLFNLAKSSRNLRAQRDLLLPKLISGEIDVSAAERVMEAAE